MSKMVKRSMYKNKCIQNREKKKINVILTTSLKNINTPPNKMSYTNSPPKNDYSHIQNCSPFLLQVTKGKSVK